LSRLFGHPRAAGVWGIVFVVLLLVSAAMVSVPAASMSGEKIVKFYSDHASLIVLQQVVGVVALAAFVLFAISLPRNRWLIPALAALAITELATNVVPLVIIASGSSADAAHNLTRVEDVLDDLFSIAIAAFVAAATLCQPVWLRIAAYVVALASVARAIADPLGFSALDVIAPLAFVAFVLVFSVKLLVRPISAPA
jgi:hypothetical protein